MAAELLRVLEIAGAVVVTETTNEARLAVATGAGSERVAFSAVGDTCPLCESLDGKVFRAASEDAKRFTPPLHINCDCMWTGVGDDEVGGLDHFTPADDESLKPLVDEHGHFVTQPDKYEVLRVPAGPSGRDFTFRRKKEPETGKVISEVEWHRPRYELPGLSEGTARVGVSEVGERAATLALKTLAKAETVPELEAWARLRFPRMAVDLAGGDVEVLRETLGQLDELGRLYRQVEVRIPSLRVAPAEEFAGNPAAFAATSERDSSIRLNQFWFGDRSGFDAAWQREVGTGRTPDLPAREAIVSHEWGEAYRLWLQAERPDLWSDAAGYLSRQKPPADFGAAAQAEPTEAFAEAFAVMHLRARDRWPGFVAALRQKLRYELRQPF